MTWSILNFCISECKPFAAVTFSIFSLQWLFSPLTFHSSSSLMPLTVTFCENHFFQKVVFEVFRFVTRSIIVLNISDLFHGGKKSDLMSFSILSIPLATRYKLFFWGNLISLHKTKTVWNLQKSKATTAGAHDVNRNYNIMMENVKLTGLNLFWYRKQ